jgi:hypothetical protein
VKTAFLSLSALACAAFAQGAVTQIELRPSVVATQAEVHLGDVAQIHTQDLRAIRELVALPLGPRPPAGSEAVIRRDVLERWVRLRLGLSRALTDWRGALETRVHTPARTRAVPARAAASVEREPGATGHEDRKPPRLVTRGDWVLLHFRSGGVELETRAQVLQDGHPGEVVRVRAWSASEPVFARVISAGAVEAGL